jgi:hypothetical protein
MRLFLDELFSTREILRHIMNPRTYPTEDHIRLSRHVGFAQFFVYYTSMLLPHDKLEFVRACGISYVSCRTHRTRTLIYNAVWSRHD